MIWAHLIDVVWERFAAKIHAPDPLGCWEWRGARSIGGRRKPHHKARSAKTSSKAYGTFTIDREAGLVVRAWSFMCEAAGIICPPGMHRDHTCANSLCVNPAHAEVVTPTENSRRRWSGKRRNHQWPIETAT